MSDFEDDATQDPILPHVTPGDGNSDAALLGNGPSGYAQQGCGCGCGAPAHECTCAGQPVECMPEDELLYDLADLFKVFADTTRIKILYALMEHDCCVADIAEAVGATQSAVSHQLRILKQARLVRFQRAGKNVIYSLADDHVYAVLNQGLTHICE